MARIRIAAVGIWYILTGLAFLCASGANVDCQYPSDISCRAVAPACLPKGACITFDACEGAKIPVWEHGRTDIEFVWANTNDPLGIDGAMRYNKIRPPSFGEYRDVGNYVEGFYLQGGYFDGATMVHATNTDAFDLQKDMDLHFSLWFQSFRPGQQVLISKRDVDNLQGYVFYITNENHLRFTARGPEEEMVHSVVSKKKVDIGVWTFVEVYHKLRHDGQRETRFFINSERSNVVVTHDSIPANAAGLLKSQSPFSIGALFVPKGEACGMAPLRGRVDHVYVNTPESVYGSRLITELGIPPSTAEPCSLVTEVEPECVYPSPSPSATATTSATITSSPTITPSPVGVNLNCSDHLDVFFLVDTSTSISAGLLQEEFDFVSTLGARILADTAESHVGAITFSDFGVLKTDLTDDRIGFEDSLELSPADSRGHTRPEEGVHIALFRFLSHPVDDSRKAIIIVTDGSPTNSAAAQRAAFISYRRHVKLIVVAVGNVDPQQLVRITGDSNTVFTTISLDDTLLHTDVLNTICEPIVVTPENLPDIPPEEFEISPSPSPSATPSAAGVAQSRLPPPVPQPSLPPFCDRDDTPILEIVFVIDRSGSMNIDQVYYSYELARSVAEEVWRQDDTAKYGIVSYATDSRTEVRMTNSIYYFLQNAWHDRTTPNGVTDDIRALRHARGLFSSDSRMVLIWLSDGGPNDLQATQLFFRQMRADGIHCIGVPIGLNRRDSVVLIIGDADSVFDVPRAEDIIQVVPSVLRSVCLEGAEPSVPPRVRPTTPPPAPSPWPEFDCEAEHVDVIIAIDTSGSVDDVQLEQEYAYARDLGRRLFQRAEFTHFHVGSVAFSHNARMRSQLTSSPQDFESATVADPDAPRSETRPEHAFYLAKSMFDEHERNFGPINEKVLILLIDGNPTNMTETLAASNLMARERIRMFGVAIDEASPDVIYQVVGGTSVQYSPTFERMGTTTRAIMSLLCVYEPYVPPPFDGGGGTPGEAMSRTPTPSETPSAFPTRPLCLHNIHGSINFVLDETSDVTDAEYAGMVDLMHELTRHALYTHTFQPYYRQHFSVWSHAATRPLARVLNGPGSSVLQYAAGDRYFRGESRRTLYPVYADLWAWYVETGGYNALGDLRIIVITKAESWPDRAMAQRAAYMITFSEEKSITIVSINQNAEVDVLAPYGSASRGTFVVDVNSAAEDPDTVRNILEYGVCRLYLPPSDPPTPSRTQSATRTETGSNHPTRPVLNRPSRLPASASSSITMAPEDVSALPSRTMAASNRPFVPPIVVSPRPGAERCAARDIAAIHILDQSGSIPSEDWLYEREFVDRVALYIDQTARNQLQGAIAFSDGMALLSDLTIDVTTVMFRYFSRYFLGGDTNMGQAIRSAVDILTAPDVDPSYDKVIIVYTDGEYTDGDETLEAVRHARYRGVAIFAVLIQNIDRSANSAGIATSDEYVFHAETFATLPDVYDALVELICVMERIEPSAMASISPTQTATGSTSSSTSASPTSSRTAAPSASRTVNPAVVPCLSTSIRMVLIIELTDWPDAQWASVISLLRNIVNDVLSANDANRVAVVAAHGLGSDTVVPWSSDGQSIQLAIGRLPRYGYSYNLVPAFDRARVLIGAVPGFENKVVTVARSGPADVPGRNGLGLSMLRAQIRAMRYAGQGTSFLAILEGAIMSSSIPDELVTVPEYITVPIRPSRYDGVYFQVMDDICNSIAYHPSTSPSNSPSASVSISTSRTPSRTKSRTPSVTASRTFIPPSPSASATPSSWEIRSSANRICAENGMVDHISTQAAGNTSIFTFHRWLSDTAVLAFSPSQAVLFRRDAVTGTLHSMIDLNTNINSAGGVVDGKFFMYSFLNQIRCIDSNDPNPSIEDLPVSNDPSMTTKAVIGSFGNYIIAAELTSNVWFYTYEYSSQTNQVSFVGRVMVNTYGRFVDNRGRASTNFVRAWAMFVDEPSSTVSVVFGVYPTVGIAKYNVDLTTGLIGTQVGGPAAQMATGVLTLQTNMPGNNLASYAIGFSNGQYRGYPVSSSGFLSAGEPSWTYPFVFASESAPDQMYTYFAATVSRRFRLNIFDVASGRTNMAFELLTSTPPTHGRVMVSPDGNDVYVAVPQDPTGIEVYHFRRCEVELLSYSVRPCTGHTCTFEGNEECDYNPLTLEPSEITFVRRSGPTGTQFTGPAAAYSGSFYLYAEASGNEGRNATITLPYSPQETTGCVSFAYHMQGSDMGTLSVERQVVGSSEWSELWVQEGDQGENWRMAQVSLGGAGTDFRIRIKAVIGDGQFSDIAIDDLTICGEC